MNSYSLSFKYSNIPLRGNYFYEKIMVNIVFYDKLNLKHMKL